MVANERPAKCEECQGTDISQDQDVLDTWFSSALWPFATLGWPETTRDFERYYPTSLLSTGFDIIFFWVARMMMMGLWFTGKVPFRDVYIHPLVRDEFGKKMTKSRGNVVDPLAIMDKYGTDAVRFTLAQLAIQGRDLVLSDERLAASKAFANKIWNAARFVLMNLQGAPQPVEPAQKDMLTLADRWILSRLNNAIQEITQAINRYEFNSAALSLYQFIWHEFCDWYIELAKEPLKSDSPRRDAARWVLAHTSDYLLRLLHPFMPFLSEELWQALRPYISEPGLSRHLAVAGYPKPHEGNVLSEAEQEAMRYCIETTEAINSLRSLLGFHPGQRVSASIRVLRGDAQRFASGFSAWRGYAMQMAKAEQLELVKHADSRDAGTVTTVLDWGEVSVRAPENYDFEKARTVLRKRLQEVGGHLEQQTRRLENPDFQSKASPEMREQIQRRAEELEVQQRTLATQLQMLAEGQ
jgi:valyl-tRNA synthetase